jgi:hypothetical protein
MRAIEVTGVVDGEGNLSLHQPVPLMAQGSVRVIILYSEQTEELEHDVSDTSDTSVEDVKANLRRALQQAASGQRIPLSQMWTGIDVD